MRKFSLSTIGTFHTNHNEDALVLIPFENQQLLLAVMDGCSMGTESHFASTLMAKILRQKVKEIDYRFFIEKKPHSTKTLLYELLQSLFLELRYFQNRLLLDKTELLSTLILGVLDQVSRSAHLFVVGDGLICCNGTYTEFEQDNRPDYLGYHLNKDFEPWFQAQQQSLILRDISDLSISTDGIFTFRAFDQKDYAPIGEWDLVHELLIDQNGLTQKNMLRKKLLYIEKNYGLKPTDDLSIVRVIFEKKSKQSN
ncbi:MAG: protein phosphatase 2C domain-containing protein [Bacteroidota bacterium]